LSSYSHGDNFEHTFVNAKMSHRHAKTLTITKYQIQKNTTFNVSE